MKHRNKMKLFAGFSLSALLTQASTGQELYDVFFLSDTTGSMGGLINSAQNSSNAIFDLFQTRGDVQFGVGEYRDGNAGSYDFQFNLTADDAGILSNDGDAVSAAIGAWSPSGGGDTPEDNLAGLTQAAAGTPWRDGSRRMIFWFGDAPGHDPASDGSTMATTLAALNAECVQVIAVDLNDLDSTGQATTIVNETLTCGLAGGILEDASSLSDAELNDEIDDILLRLFDEIVVGGDSPVAVDSAARLAGISMTRTMTRNVSGRLARLRAGGPGALEFNSIPVASADPKGGLSMDSKGGLEPAPARVEAAHRWNVWGDAYLLNEEFDAQRTAAGALASPDVDLDIYGGTVGVDYRLDSNWTLGIGFGAARGDADMGRLGDIDIDSFAIMPYLSFYQADVIGAADVYADLMYAYTDSEYDFGAFDLDGEAHQIELNIGLNYGSGGWIHGPFAQVRYLDGEIDNGGDFESFATQLGYQVSHPVAVNGGTLVPHASLAWEHEFEADQGSIGGLNLGELDEDLFVGGLGVEFLSDQNWNVGLNYQARLGEDSESHYVGINAGFRF